MKQDGRRHAFTVTTDLPARQRARGARAVRCLLLAIGTVTVAILASVALRITADAARRDRMAALLDRVREVQTEQPHRVRADGALTQRTWIDTDPSCGLDGWKDVDDCFALVDAIRSPAIAVVGIGASYGNATVDDAEERLRTLRSVMRRERPLPAVYRGPASARSIGASTDATSALIRALESGPLRVLALGPLTNVASVLILRPDLADRIVEVITVAGRRDEAQFAPGRWPLPLLSDLNFCKDLGAIETVLAAHVPLTLLPYEAAIRVAITPADLATIRNANATGRWLAETSDSWLTLWKVALGRSGFPPFDNLAVGYALEPQQFVCFPVAARVRAASGWRYPIIGHELFVERIAGAADVRYCPRARPEFKSSLLRRLTESSGA